MTEAKESIRPILEISGSAGDSSAVEKFQNAVLRPIIKLQHDLLVAFFEDYLICKKIDLTNLDAAKKKDVISRILKNDNAFKIEVRGLVIGLLTVAEYHAYLPIAGDVKKRMMAMISQRLISVS